MRNFIWYNVDGVIKGQTSFDGGMPDESDPRTNTNHFYGKILKETVESQPDHSGWLAVNCPCDSSKIRCSCAEHIRLKNYVENGQLVPKVPVSIVINNVTLPTNTRDIPSKSTPGTSLIATLKGNVPDGSQCNLVTKGNPKLMLANTILTFTNQVSQPFTLVSPAQGFIGSIGARGKYILDFPFYIIGWTQ